MSYLILDNHRVKHNYFKLTVEVPSGGAIPIPGQFYNIRCGDSMDPLLRRPFSLHRLIEDGGTVTIEFLYLVIGKGTEWLSIRKPGEHLDMIGPLGNGFIIGDNVRDAALVARGIGMAPLYAVSEALYRKNQDTKIHILVGARLKERIFYERELSKIGKVYIYTDDGSQGFHGRAPDLFLYLLENHNLPDGLSLFACGPPTMLKDLADISNRFSIRGQVALESHMGCGFGVCLSCAFPLRPQRVVKNEHWEKPALQRSEDGKTVYALICRDGPIFDIQEVDWDEWLA